MAIDTEARAAVLLRTSSVGGRLEEVAAEVQQSGRSPLLLKLADRIESLAEELRQSALELAVQEGRAPQATAKKRRTLHQVMAYLLVHQESQRERMRTEMEGQRAGGLIWTIAGAKKELADDLLDYIAGPES